MNDYIHFRSTKRGCSTSPYHEDIFGDETDKRLDIVQYIPWRVQNCSTEHFRRLDRGTNPSTEICQVLDWL